MPEAKWGFTLCILDRCERCRKEIEQWLNLSMTHAEIDAIKHALIENKGDHDNGQGIDGSV